MNNARIQYDSRYISNELRNAILERDENRCRYCGTDRGPFHIDHVYPHVDGGRTIYSNLVTACISCNKSKIDKIGIWPKPIGYFKRHSPFITLVTLLGVMTMMQGALWINDGFYVVGKAVFLVGVMIAMFSICSNLLRH